MLRNKVVGLSVLGLLILLALPYVFGIYELQFYKFYQPKKEGVRREVFKQTRSYNEAKLQELIKYRLEYLRATDEVEKKAIASTIRHAFAEYDSNKLPSELKAFLDEIKYN